MPASASWKSACDVGARADVATAVLAVQHRSAREHDGRQVDARRAHHAGRRRLVAADQQHDAIDRVAANRLLDVHAGEVAEQHGRGAQLRFAERHHGELEREATGLVHAVLDVLGEVTEVRVARRELRPRVADADDRPAVEDVIGMALVLHPAAMDEGVAVGAGEPGSAAALRLLRVRHGFSTERIS
jgi:hypothetical protein